MNNEELAKPDLNKPVFKLYPGKAKLIEAGQCPFCGEVIEGPEDFRDELSRREYSISGICQACQDRIFGKEEEV
jgi:hypothetical protein